MSRLQPVAGFASLAAAGILALVAPIFDAAPAETLLRLEDYPVDELQTAGFELPRAAHVEIDAVGARPRHADALAAYAWLLNAATREVVWSQENGDDSRVSGKRLLRRSREEIDLPAGRYELYAWAGSFRTSIRVTGDDASDRVRRFFLNFSWDERGDERELRRAARDCYVELRSKDLAKRDLSTFEPTGEMPGALFRAARLGDGAFVEAGLRLDRPLDLRIYALCELPHDSDAIADGGWIVNAATRERVWQTTRRNTRQGGGADKNRLFDDTVHLDAGRYVLCFGTDGSHDCGQWNASPPCDPLAWGITLLPGSGFDAAAFHVDEKFSRGEPLLALTRLGDQESVERAFRLAHDAELQIYAIGEWTSKWDELADRGWITKAGSDDVVWEMTDRNTEPAGGAEKNRLFDGTVKLPEGEYVAHFETDDSHSYEDWNADAPFDAAAWGLAIYPGTGTPGSDFRPVDAVTTPAPADVLARLVEVGDDADLRHEFQLDGPARVHVYALGEGLDHDMFDYGWIENARTRDVVWKMTTRNTRPAGGARKNRKFDGDVRLEAGTYVVHYETDGSHSFGNWNDRRPPDPQSWGITVTRTAPGAEPPGRGRDR